MEEKGVWKTISGRRVFIKEGQSLSDAMKDSGKFKQDDIQAKIKKQFDKKNNTKDRLKQKEDELQQLEQEKQRLVEERLEAINKASREAQSERKRIENEHKRKFYKKHPELDDKDKHKVWMQSDEYRQLSKELDSRRWDLTGTENEEYRQLTQPINKIRDKIDTLQRTIKQSKLDAEIKSVTATIKDTEANFKNIQRDHQFYNKDIKYSFEDLDLSDSWDVKKGVGLIAVDKIAKEYGLDINESPYSFSTYAFEKGGTISWGSKPAGSYRLSDHWNFESRNSKHCLLSDRTEYTQKLILAKFNGKTYDVVKEWD